MLALKGWRIVAAAAAILAALICAAAALAPDMVAGLRMIIRWTARLSLLLFLTAFTASALARLVPAPWTTALLARRRQLGLSFALSHFVHLAAILLFAATDPALFRSLTNTATIASGSLAYLFIAALALTSFDAAPKRMGWRAWQTLHRIGIWYIFVSFVVAFGKRAVLDATYWPAMALLAVSLAIRISAALCPRGNRDGTLLHSKG
ncbi:MAG: ferric reductase-like transmembrane domain-containing protein [Proteobacteria bacterium]|nr:ferric reductase-like transmembrane domain-containing protein [Pseudomonadota bacterium]